MTSIVDTIIGYLIGRLYKCKAQFLGKSKKFSKN